MRPPLERRNSGSIALVTANTPTRWFRRFPVNLDASSLGNLPLLREIPALFTKMSQFSVGSSMKEAAGRLSPGQ